MNFLQVIEGGSRNGAAEKIESASYWLESILRRIYSKEKHLDKFLLECDLDELCHILGVEMPKGPVQIDRKIIKG